MAPPDHERHREFLSILKSPGFHLAWVLGMSSGISSDIPLLRVLPPLSVGPATSSLSPHLHGYTCVGKPGLNLTKGVLFLDLCGALWGVHVSVFFFRLFLRIHNSHSPSVSPI